MSSLTPHADLVRLLAHRAETSPELPIYGLVSEGRSAGASIDCATLFRRARAIAASLQREGNVRGERVILPCPSTLEAIVAFWGLVCAGAIPVPVPALRGKHSRRLSGIVRACRPSLLMIPDGERVPFEASSWPDDLRDLKVVHPARMADEEAEVWQAPPLDSQAIAFLQYTSGSTGMPKGVMVSHDDLLVNARRQEEAFALRPETRCLFWLPLYHDMGLIGGMLQAVYTGYPTLFMSPAAFVERPLRWLEAMSAARATVSGGPNFGYELTARTLEASPPLDLDLRGWEVAFSGAEPVREETLRRFARAAQPYGFKPGALRPCYGLAEATLFVSAGRWTDEPGVRSEPARVALGPPASGLSIAIVDPATGECLPDGERGEVWISGPGVARGYWGDADATRETFGAQSIDGGGQKWLRTGDVGMMRDGQVFILDRLKDVIIMRGANHYAHDIEAVVEACHPAIRTHSVAAFGIVDGNEEQLVIVAELERGGAEAADEIESAVQRSLAEHLQLSAHDVVLVRHGTIPRTSSGKIRRRACRDLYLAHEIRPLGASRRDPTSEPGHAMMGIIASALRVRPADVPLDRDIGSLGIDSLRIAQAKFAIERLLGHEIGYSALLDLRVSDLVTAAGRTPHATTATTAFAAEGVEAAEAVAVVDVPLSIPLSIGQRALLYMHELRPDEHAYTIARALRLRGPLDAAAFTSALRALGERHQALRMTLSFEDGEPRQRFTSGVSIEERDATDWDDTRLREEMSALTRVPFDLRNGPLVTAFLFRRSADEHVLVLRAHHLAVDLWSLALLLDELEEIYRTRKAGLEIMPRTAPQYGDVVSWQHALVRGPAGQRLGEFWYERLKDDVETLALPMAHPSSSRRPGAGKHPFELDAETTEALRRVCRTCGVTLNTLFIAACQILLARHSGQRRFLMGTLASGRTRAELTDVIGYCVNLIPLRADVRLQEPFESFLRRTRAELTTALDHQDLPFSAIVERLRPRRSVDRSPLIRAVCVCQPASIRPGRDLRAVVLNQSGGALRLDDLLLESIEMDEAGAQFDLSWIVTDGGDGVGGDGLSGVMQYESSLFAPDDIAAMAHSLRTLLRAIAARPSQPVGELPLVGSEEYLVKTAQWNGTARTYDEASCVHDAVARQAARTPEATALIHRSRAWTYGELMQRVRACAGSLRQADVGPEVRVAVCLERSLELVAALLGISMAGGAYVALDPAHPRDRLERIVRASSPAAIVTSRGLMAQLDGCGVPLHSIDELCETVDGAEHDVVHPPASSVHPDNALYVMFTSGSTGAPKGVVVSHRQVMNLFAGMDDAVGCGPADTLIAVTSVAFDISVVELLWTLARGARVVVADDLGAHPVARRRRARGLAFSLFYFADSDSGDRDRERRYELLIEGAKYADRHQFAAVWTPERHFHPFGGLYPNPSLTSAALATVTSRIQLRAGSVVLPLHHPIRVAEEWAVVDNLSGGRAGVAFASGWHAEDFSFCPDAYADRKAIMFERIETVRALWRGDGLTVRGGDGQERSVRLFPRPIQPELPMWLTAAGAPETFGHAARLSASVLTHLLGQSLESLRERIALYTSALTARALDPSAFDVTLMLHAYVDDTHDRVMASALEPFKQYLRSSLDLVGRLIKVLQLDLDLDRMTPDDLDALIDFAAQRYMSISGLFGTPRECLDKLDQLVDIGVTEVACLVDFGVERAAAMASIERLARMREQFNAETEPVDYSIPAQAARSGATMMQCTPSMLAMILGDAGMAERLRSMRAMLLGGEPLPIGLLADLGFPGHVMNMYGPTETTVWSAAARTLRDVDRITIAGPLANTQLHVLDDAARPLPEGVIGEVWIGGAGVSRGYWNEPALTAERFRPDPFGPDPFGHGAGARLYRTGDLGRRLHDGSIELLGRTDQQVKLRGYRVELGDVEAALNAVTGVRMAIAVKHHDAQRGDELVAYVVPDESGRFDPDQARASLASTLPPYMVPGVIVSAASLPVTANHKVDRRRLAQLAVSAVPSRRPAAGPRTEWETHVHRIWQEVLGVDVRSVDDNFFEVGGHSLLIARVHERLQREIGWTFPLLVLLERPTIRGVAEFLEQRRLTTVDDASARAADQRRAWQAHRQVAVHAGTARTHPA